MGACRRRLVVVRDAVERTSARLSRRDARAHAASMHMAIDGAMMVRVDLVIYRIGSDRIKRIQS